MLTLASQGEQQQQLHRKRAQHAKAMDSRADSSGRPEQRHEVSQVLHEFAMTYRYLAMSFIDDDSLVGVNLACVVRTEASAVPSSGTGSVAKQHFAC